MPVALLRAHWAPWRDRLSPSIEWHKRGKEKKKGFFAVWRGHQSGVFHKWSDVLDCIRDYDDPGFKGFPSLSEATAYLNNKLRCG